MAARYDGRRFPLSSGVQFGDVIVKSWSRCRMAGVDPRNTPLRRVSEQDLQRRLADNRDLVEIADLHLKWLATAMVGVEHVVYVVDRDGIVLHSVCSDPESARKGGLEPGFDWSERTMGTNGAGTALAADRPVVIVRHEHFACALDGWTCAAAPIHGPNGQIVGAVDTSTTAAGSDPGRVVLVAYAASMIERELASRADSHPNYAGSSPMDTARAERLRLLEQSEGEVRNREAALAMVGHEIRNPLFALQLQLRTLIDDIELRGDLHTHCPDWRERLQDLLDTTKRIGRMLNDFLDVALASAGKISLQPELTDLGEIVRDVVRRIQRMEQNCPPIRLMGPPSVIGMWDRMRIDQVAANLVLNAVKHSLGKAIEVVIDSDAAKAWLEVRDNGIGIAPQDQERIFEPFERAGDRDIGGYGLGLWIVRKITDALGGKITVVSRPELGATFVVELPRFSNSLLPAEPVKHRNRHKFSNSPITRPIKVAIIDDDESVRKALARLLKSAGLEAIAFSSAREFLDDPVHAQVECAVIDVQMPGLDGVKLQERLEQTLPDLSVVFLTGRRDDPTGARATKAGAVDLLLKPVDAKTLLASIGRAVQRSRQPKVARRTL